MGLPPRSANRSYRQNGMRGVSSGQYAGERRGHKDSNGTMCDDNGFRITPRPVRSHSPYPARGPGETARPRIKPPTRYRAGAGCRKIRPADGQDNRHGGFGRPCRGSIAINVLATDAGWQERVSIGPTRSIRKIPGEGNVLLARRGHQCENIHPLG